VGAAGIDGDEGSESFAAFEARSLAAGFDAAVERRWDPGQEVEPHSHPFAASARVVQGEMWLTVDGRTRHLCPGDRFELDADVSHSERYGSQGAVYWVARRHRSGG
jgi:hypothetical protein